MKTIEERVAAVETSSRRWRLTAVVMFGALLVSILVGQAKPASPPDLIANKIKANDISIVDEKGTQRLSLYGFQDICGLNLYDKEGKDRGTLCMAGDGDALLRINSADNKNSINLTIPSVGDPQISIDTSDGNSMTIYSGWLRGSNKKNETVFKVP